MPNWNVIKKLKNYVSSLIHKKSSGVSFKAPNYNTEDYQSLLRYVNFLADHKMGYPVSLLNYIGVVDNSSLGIKKGTLANVLLNNVGDPFKDSETSLLEVKRHEREIIYMLERYFGVEKDGIRGYVTTGGTEGNFAGIWWSKRYLISSLLDKLGEYDHKVNLLLKSDQELMLEYSKISDSNEKEKVSHLQKMIETKNDLNSNKLIINQILTPTIFFTKKHTHYSLIKIAEILKLNIRTIDSDEFGAMNLDSLHKEILLHIGSHPHSPIIIVANIGTTVTGAIDNVPGIKQLMESLKSKPLYTIHMDGALTGFLLPILKPFGDVSNYLDGIGANTLAFSAHKYPGLSQPCGVVLSSRYFYEKSFDKSERSIEYVGNILDITISGSRSGLMVLMFYHALITLGLNRDYKQLEGMVKRNLETATYLYNQLKSLYGDDQVSYPFHFNISFPRPSADLSKKYQLMLTGDRANICVLTNVSRGLMREFINDLKHEKENAMTKHDDHNTYQVELLTSKHEHEVLALFVDEFCHDEPITKHLKIHELDYKTFAHDVVKKAIYDKLSHVLLDKEGKIVGCAIAEDLADPFKPNVSHYPKLKPIFSLIQTLSKPFTDHKHFMKGKIVHLWIAAITKGHQGHHLFSQVAMACIRDAAHKGYDFAYAEFTNDLSESITKQFGLLRLCNKIAYDDFVYENGKRPFSGVKGYASAYVASIRPGVTLDQLESVVLSHELPESNR